MTARKLSREIFQPNLDAILVALRPGDEDVLTGR